MVEKGPKFFTGCKDAKKSSIFLRKMSAYKKNFDETKDIYFVFKNDGLLEKYNEI